MITKKEIRLSLLSLAIAFIAEIFLLLSAQYYKTNTVIAYGFLAIAYILFFIVLFIIYPMFMKN